MIDAADIVLRGGQTSDLALTLPPFRNSTITPEDGATLRIVTRDVPTGVVGSTLTFEGDNLITFDDRLAAIRGPNTAISQMNMVVGPGTTRFVGASLPGPNGGLRASFITVYGGTLDLRAMRADTLGTSGVTGLLLRSGATFQDTFESDYRGLGVLTVENSTLRTVSGSGAFSAPSTGSSARASRMPLSTSPGPPRWLPVARDAPPGSASFQSPRNA